MNEQLLQFIWQFQYFNKESLKTCTGEQIEIVSAGILNKNQGPDFADAKIRIGNTLWAGTVELHLCTSDWNKHGHTNDENYKNIILHVVFENDQPPTDLPVLELKDRIANSLLSRYQSLMLHQHFIPCEKMIGSVGELTINMWQTRLVTERLERKLAVINDYLLQTNQHWEECFWWLLAKNFGVKTNAQAFEAIAKSVSINILAKHKNQLIQLEALLMGQAGLLNLHSDDKYVHLLKKEYQFLKAKYHLKPIHFPVHFLRMRPGNFPTIRLAQLAALIAQSVHLFSKIVEAPSLAEVEKWFTAPPNDFWNYHYTLQDEAHFKTKTIGNDMVHNIIINTIVPMLFAYGTFHQNQNLKDKALAWLDQTTAEQNTIIKGFKALNFTVKSAWQSQSLIELKTQYCDQKKCLYCAIGNSILKQ